MSRATEYAKWIEANQDKQGTPEFEDVAKAYRLLRRRGPAPVPKEDGFVENVSRRLEGRGAEVAETVQELASREVTPIGTALAAGSFANPLIAAAEQIYRGSRGEIGTQEAALQTVGKGVAGPVLDIVGEGVVSGLKSLAEAFPTATKKTKEIISGLAESDAGQSLISALSEGADAYESFKKDNPRAAKNIESVANIGLLFAGPKAKASAKPSVGERFSAALKRGAEAQKMEQRTKFVTNLVTPKKTAKVLREEAKRATEKGLLKKQVVTPTRSEREMIAATRGIKDVKPSNTYQGNLTAVQAENTRLAQGLEKTLSKSKATITPDDAISEISKKADLLIAENPAIVGSAATSVERVGKKAAELVRANEATPLGVLRARRELDRWLTQGKGARFWSSDTENALQIAAKGIRNTMNDVIERAVPGTKQSLRKQSALFDVIDNVAVKAADEYNTILGRVFQNVGRVLPVRNRLIQDSAAALGIGGLGAAAIVAPYLSGAFYVAAAGYLGHKLVSSPGIKKAIANLIKLTDDALNVAKNKSMVRQLRADRGALAQIMEDIQEISSEDSKEEKVNGK